MIYNKDILKLLKVKKFKEIEKILVSNKYEKDAFQEFYIELCNIQEYTALEYFYDNFSNKIYDKKLYLAVYSLCNDSTKLPLIKKLSKDKIFKNEFADYYVLRTISGKAYDILDYFLNNFPLNIESKCKKILNKIILNEKEEFFDILYKKYFYQKDKEKIWDLLEINNKNSLVFLFKKNNKSAFYFISVFKLEDYLIKNIEKLNNTEEIKNKILKELNIIKATRNF